MRCASKLLTIAGLLISFLCHPALADSSTIQMLPPTAASGGSTVCGTGTNNLLTMAGNGSAGASAINCVANTRLDASGNMVVPGTFRADGVLAAPAGINVNGKGIFYPDGSASFSNGLTTVNPDGGLSVSGSLFTVSPSSGVSVGSGKATIAPDGGITTPDIKVGGSVAVSTTVDAANALASLIVSCKGIGGGIISVLADGSLKCGGVQSCTVPNGMGMQTFNPATGAFGACYATSCTSGYTLYNGACYSNNNSCSVSNGTGYQNFDAATGAYDGTCIVSACNSGYSLVSGACVQSQTTINLNYSTACGGWCACHQAGTSSPTAPNPNEALAICKYHGYNNLISYTLGNGPGGQWECHSPDGSTGCYTNAYWGNYICTSVTCGP